MTQGDGREQPAGSGRPPIRRPLTRRLPAWRLPAWGRADRAGRTALVLGAFGVCYRLVLVTFHAPPTNSDEATMGLAALHIAEGRHFPVFFYGQHYMGVLEAYLAAPLVWLAGPHTLALRLPVLAMYPVFLWAVYRLARRLYSPGLAVLSVALLALGSDRIVKNQLIAAGGYPEINLAGAVVLMLAVEVGLDRVRRRTLALSGAAFLSGLCLWVDWLVLPYLAVAVGLLLVTARGHQGGRVLVPLAAGALGAAPVLLYSLTARPGEDPVSVFLRLSAGSGAPLADRLYGGVLYGIPMGTGQCSPGHCHGIQMWWGIGYPVLVVAAGALAVAGVLRGSTPRPERIHQAGRLALVTAAVLSILSYTLSASAARYPVESARYLSCLLISTPAVLYPLWTLVRRAAGRPVWLRVAATAPLGALLAGAVFASGAALAGLPGDMRLAHRQQQLIARLRALGVTRMYSDYWTCNRITFATREGVTCAVLDDDLAAGNDRYPPYRAMLAGAGQPAYVFPVPGAAAETLTKRLNRAGITGTRTDIAGYRIFQPETRPPNQ